MRFLTAGESHGPGLVVIVEGIPRGLAVTPETFARDLRRRQSVYGRGPRSAAEPEQFEVLGGIRAGATTGAPVSILLRHRQRETWRAILDPWAGADAAGFKPTSDLAGVEAYPTRPRPGHADLAAAYKYGLREFRDAIERASARETAARTVAGALAKSFLERFGITVHSYVASIGEVRAAEAVLDEDLRAAEGSRVRTADPEAETRMIAAIDEARAKGETLGGTFVVAARGVPPGLGSYAQWDRRLDARLAWAVMSIPSVKGVEIGPAFFVATLAGSAAHDPILPDADGGLRRGGNLAGGIEGGLTNGQPVLVRAAVKPVPTLASSLPSVDLRTGAAGTASYERSDTCVVPAAAVVGEAMVAWILAEAFLDKFGGDTMRETERAFHAYRADWLRPGHE